MVEGQSMDTPDHAVAAADSARAMLRHTLATLAYRAGKVVRDAPAAFADLLVAPATRTPVAILSHMADLIEWGLSMAQGHSTWREDSPDSWDAEVERFFAALTAFDQHLAGDVRIEPRWIGPLFQGPVADALTHTGQLAMLRRLAGSPVRGENYARAEIIIGNVSIVQPAPRLEFD